MKKIILLLWVLSFVFLGCKEDVLNLKIRYDQIQGLQEGDRVIFQQNQIGAVKSVFYSEKGFYTVDTVIRKNVATTATEYSRFFILTDPQIEDRKAIEMIQTRKGGSILENNTTVEGSTATSAFFEHFFHGFLEGYEDLKKEFERFSKDLSNIPESEEFKKLEDELKRLKEDMKASGEEVKRKIQEELLPRIREEMEKLKERLRELGREDEMKPLEIEMENMKKI